MGRHGGHVPSEAGTLSAEAAGSAELAPGVTLTEDRGLLRVRFSEADAPTTTRLLEELADRQSRVDVDTDEATHLWQEVVGLPPLVPGAPVMFAWPPLEPGAQRARESARQVLSRAGGGGMSTLKNTMDRCQCSACLATRPL